MTSLLTIPPSPPQWQPATWADYERSRDVMVEGEGQIFFHDGYLWIDMGGEGINHSRFNDLITLVFFIWFSQKAPQQVFDSMSGCLLEKQGHDDTTLATDLDQKKQLYAALGMPEYWVVDVKGLRVLAFRLDNWGRYQEISVSVALAGLPIGLLTETLAQLHQGISNSVAAQWFGEQIRE
jgi:Uma2 family endonuclease